MNIAIGAVVGQRLPAMVKFLDLKSPAFWMIWKFRQRIVSLYECVARFYLTKGCPFPGERIQCALILLLFQP